MSTRKNQRKVVEARSSKRQNHPAGRKNGEFGQKLTPSPNPPDTTATPWWPLVISCIRRPGDYTFTLLIADFLKQVGQGHTFNPTDFNEDKGNPFRIQLRIDRVSVWNLTGRIVSLSIWDVEERADTKAVIVQTDLLGGWVDCGGVNCFPAVGFQYPSSHHRRVYRPDPRYASVKLFTTTGGSTDSILSHVHIQWRADGLPKFSTVSSGVEEISSQISELSTKLDKESPSLGSKVIDKVGPVLANYVIPLALGESVPGTSLNIGSIVGNPVQCERPPSPLSPAERPVDPRSPSELSECSYDACKL